MVGDQVTTSLYMLLRSRRQHARLLETEEELGDVAVSKYTTATNSSRLRLSNTDLCADGPPYQYSGMRGRRTQSGNQPTRPRAQGRFDVPPKANETSGLIYQGGSITRGNAVPSARNLQAFAKLGRRFCGREGRRLGGFERCTAGIILRGTFGEKLRHRSYRNGFRARSA